MSDSVFKGSDQLLELLRRLNLDGEAVAPMNTLRTCVSSQGR